MLKLSKENFYKAKKFIYIHGRELEQKRFEHEFENGSSHDLLEVLRKHQNQDGGFQDMGEGDRNCSSPIGTSVAFQLLLEIGASSSEEIVQRGIDYLLASYNHESNYWQPSLGREYKTASEMHKGWANPSAEIVGYLLHYSDLVPEEFLQKVIDTACINLNSLEDPIDPFSMLCFMRLSECIDEPYKSMINNRLRDGVGRVIEKDSSKWSSYCAKPFWFATSPNSHLFDVISENVLESLNSEIITQSPEGYFILNWHVTGDDERIWKSIWTVDALIALKNHGLIDDY